MDISERFFKYYINITDNYRGNFRYFTVFGAMISLVCLTILLPIVFSVQKTNNKVLSLFGYIKSDEIK